MAFKRMFQSAAVEGRVVRRAGEVSRGPLETRSPETRSPVAGVAVIRQDEGCSPQKDTRVASVDKTIMDLDGPIGWPVVGNFITYLKKENRGKMHLVQERYHKRYGTIFREKWGPKWQVHVSDPDLIEQVFRQQGQFPDRPVIQAWRLYREVAKKPMGLSTAQGKEWHKYRSAFNKKALCPRTVANMIEPFNGISKQLVEKIRHVRTHKGNDVLANELPQEVYNWGMESVGHFLFETRLGCLNVDIPPRTKMFIDNVANMFSTSTKIIVGEKFHHKWNTRFWTSHVEAWDNIFETGKSFIDERVNELERRLVNGEDPATVAESAPFLTYMLATNKLSAEEIYANITELFLAGIDTTANSLCFALHLLAGNPAVQERLHKEVTTVLAGKSEPSASDLEKMTYLKCVVKEVLRYYPVVTMNCRILKEDIMLQGHKIPKQTLFVLNHYATARDGKVFEEPEAFKPERWLREGHGCNYHPFASVPFGFGSRSCIGQRIARHEMYLALSKLTTEFFLEPNGDMKFEPFLRTVLTPGSRVPVTFTDRR